MSVLFDPTQVEALQVRKGVAIFDEISFGTV